MSTSSAGGSTSLSLSQPASSEAARPRRAQPAHASAIRGDHQESPFAGRSSRRLAARLGASPPTSCSLSSTRRVDRSAALRCRPRAPRHIRRARPARRPSQAARRRESRAPAPRTPGLLDVEQLQRLVVLALSGSAGGPARSCATCASSASFDCRRPAAAASSPRRSLPASTCCLASSRRPAACTASSACSPARSVERACRPASTSLPSSASEVRVHLRGLLGLRGRGTSASSASRRAAPSPSAMPREDPAPVLAPPVAQRFFLFAIGQIVFDHGSVICCSVSAVRAVAAEPRAELVGDLVPGQLDLRRFGAQGLETDDAPFGFGVAEDQRQMRAALVGALQLRLEAAAAAVGSRCAAPAPHRAGVPPAPGPRPRPLAGDHEVHVRREPPASRRAAARSSRHDALLAQRPADGRRGLTAELRDQPVVASAGAHRILRAELGRHPLENGVRVVVEPAHQARIRRRSGCRPRRGDGTGRRSAGAIPRRGTRVSIGAPAMTSCSSGFLLSRMRSGLPSSRRRLSSSSRALCAVKYSTSLSR